MMIRNIFCLIFSFALASSSLGQEKQDTFKVLSYNLRFGELASLEQLAEFIKRENPDLVALQEVDVNTYRDRAPDQNGKNFINELAYHTGMFGAYGKTIDYKGGYYGIGILSKYPLAATERVFLPKTEHGKEQRALLIADIEYRDKTYLTFISTHLDYTNTKERQIQVKELNALLKDKPHPIIIAGDFNAEPSSEEISKGMSNWLQTCNDNPTIPAKNPKAKIDYIFAYPKEKWDVIDTKNFDLLLSDHLPVEATLKLKK